jgi:hypothetical protein
MVWQPRFIATRNNTTDYAELLIELARYEKEISGRLLRKEYAEARRAANDLRLVIEDLIDLLRGAE